ncbi:MAG: hypothetical protein ACRCSN_10875 [Dermatophilaceae bacterium]
MTDFVSGNTRMRARTPALSELRRPTRSETEDAIRSTLRAVPGAYVGKGRAAALALIGRHDLADCLALLRGAVSGADPASRLDAVRAVGLVTADRAADIARAGDGSAAIGRLARHGLPHPAVASGLGAAWERFELHGDVPELEVDIASATHAAWKADLGGGRDARPVLDLLEEERDRRNVVAVADGTTPSQVALLPRGLVDDAALAAAATDSWAPVSQARHRWRPAIDRWPTHRDPAVLERELRDAGEVPRRRWLRQGDPFTAEVLVAYVLHVEAALRQADSHGSAAA